MAVPNSNIQQKIIGHRVRGVFCGMVVLGLLGCVRAGADDLTKPVMSKTQSPKTNEAAKNAASYRLIITFLHPVTANSPELLMQMSHYAAAEVTYIRAIDATMHVYQVQPQQAEPIAALITRLQSFQNVKAVDEDRVLMRQ